MVNRVNLHRSTGRPNLLVTTGSQRAPSSSFASVLSSQLKGVREVKFSAHAIQRLRERNITFGSGEKAQLGRALDQAEAKGARETLLLMDGTALVASVPNRTIITVVPNQEQDTVFTNIDSAVVVGQRAPLPIA